MGLEGSYPCIVRYEAPYKTKSPSTLQMAIAYSIILRPGKMSRRNISPVVGLQKDAQVFLQSNLMAIRKRSSNILFVEVIGKQN